MTDRAAYPCDLSDARWALIAPHLSAWRQARTDAGRGRPHRHPRPAGNLQRDPLRQPHRHRLALPAHDFPSWQTVYGYFSAWTTDGVFDRINYQLTGLARTKAGRKAQPTAGVIDTQSVKTSTNAPTAPQGIDAGKKIVGCCLELTT